MTKREEPWHKCQCPKCFSTIDLDVAAVVWVRLTASGSDADEANDGTHEWDDTSAIQCHACDHDGKVAEFRVGKDNPFKEDLADDDED